MSLISKNFRIRMHLSFPVKSDCSVFHLTMRQINNSSGESRKQQNKRGGNSLPAPFKVERVGIRRPQHQDLGIARVWPPGTRLEVMGPHFSGLDLIFWGTGGGNPSAQRCPTALSVKAGGKSWLFDAGEGTTRQMAISRVIKHADLHSIFITHLHGDHVYGLPGIMRTMDKVAYGNGREDLEKIDEPLRIFGPPGLYSFICASVKLTGTAPKRNIDVIEMYSNDIERSTPNWVKTCIKEHEMNSISHNKITPASDGYWTCLDDGEHTVRAGLINHTNGMKCFGFVIKEEDMEGTIDSEKCKALGLPPGREYAALKRGEDVTTTEGVIIKSSQVVGPKKKGRKVTILGDTYDASNLIELAMESDLVVHEATLDNSMEHKSRLAGHGCPRVAATFAKEAQAASLVLTHFSPRFYDSKNHKATALLKRQAGQVFKSGPIIAAEDFMVIQIPQKK